MRLEVLSRTVSEGLLLEQKRRRDAAIMIQCRERQRQAKAEVERRRLAREQEKASRLIQRVARGRRGRREAARLRERDEGRGNHQEAPSEDQGHDGLS